MKTQNIAQRAVPPDAVPARVNSMLEPRRIKMPCLELATWVMAGLTAVLAGATIVYAIETHKMNKSSKETQRLVEEQNSIMAAHNTILKEQLEALRGHTEAITQQSMALIHIEQSISNLPFDAQEIKERKERSKGT
jgi:hypothetical protein